MLDRIVEIHLLQNFVPSNLNRDDTGAPKDCEFGGHRRIRISSQCQKRALRMFVKDQRLLPADDLGHRTKRLVVEELPKRLADKPADEVRRVAEKVLAGKKLAVKPDNGKTEYLLFLGEREVAKLANLVLKHWDALAVPPDPPASQAAASAPVKKVSAKDRKKAAAAAVPEEIAKALETLLDGGKAADIAMFGRMLADLPDGNIDAACQVAHALGVNKAQVELDYYTAVDDLKPGEDTGADMIGTVDLASACFYRYMAIHTRQLLVNLQGDAELAGKAVSAFLQAAIEATPTGMQNGTAPFNPPSLVVVVVRPRGQWNLANAFVVPVGGDDAGLVANAAAKLDEHWDDLAGRFGTEGFTVGVVRERGLPLNSLENHVKATYEELRKLVADALEEGGSP